MVNVKEGFKLSLHWVILERSKICLFFVVFLDLGVFGPLRNFLFEHSQDFFRGDLTFREVKISGESLSSLF